MNGSFSEFPLPPAFPDLGLRHLSALGMEPSGVRYKRSTCIVTPPPERYAPLNINDPMWLHLPRWLRVEHIDAPKGRRMEHVRR